MPLGTRTDWFTRQIRDSNPAPGYRGSGNGTLYNLGYGGFGWSSSVPAGSSNVLYLAFNYSELIPQNYNYRAYARQVRCLLE